MLGVRVGLEGVMGVCILMGGSLRYGFIYIYMMIVFIQYLGLRGWEIIGNWNFEVLNY